MFQRSADSEQQRHDGDGAADHHADDRRQKQQLSDATDEFVLASQRVAPLPYGYKVTVDDGSGPILVFVNTQTGIDVGALRAGDRIAVTGFSSQYESHYEVDPRSPADIVPLS